MLNFYLRLLITFFSSCILTGHCLHGGRKVKISQYPYVVSLRRAGTHYCGGTILNEKFILLAAHCLVDKNNKSLINKNQFKILTGTNNQEDVRTGTLYDVEKMIVHEKYNSQVLAHDIALLKVKGRIPQPTDEQLRVRFPLSEPPLYARLTVVGWGKVDNCKTETKNSKYLRALDMFRITNQECMTNYEIILRDEQVCVIRGQGCGICHGDSGSPLMFGNIIIGIASGFFNEETCHPDVFVKTWPYISWINENMLQYYSLEE